MERLVLALGAEARGVTVAGAQIPEHNPFRPNSMTKHRALRWRFPSHLGAVGAVGAG